MVKRTRLQLSGLTCGACEKVISKRLKTIQDVEEVHVSSVNGSASIMAKRPIDIKKSKSLQGTHYK